MFYSFIIIVTLFSSQLSGHTPLVDVLKKDLLKSAETVDLTADQKRLLNECLQNDCTACNKLKKDIEGKEAEDTAHIIAENGKKLQELLTVTNDTNADKKALLIEYQKNATHYLEQLDTILPCACFLYYFYEYRYLCNSNYGDDRGFQERHPESCHSYSDYTDIVVIDERGDFQSIPFNDALKLEHIHKAIAQTKKGYGLFSAAIVHFLTHDDFVTVPPRSVLFPKRPEHSGQGSDSANIYRFESLVWTGKRESDTQQQESELKPLCARGGLFADALKKIYYKEKKLTALITALDAWRAALK